MKDSAFTPTLRRLGAGLAGVALVFTAACSGGEAGPGADTTGSESTGSAVEVEITPQDGSTEVQPNLPVTVTAANGTITDVKITQAAGEQAQTAEVSTEQQESTDSALDEITGTLNEDKTEWVSDWTLTPGSDVTVTATAEGEDGEKTEVVSEFSTLPATEGKRLELQSNFPVSGDTVGVGMPIIVNFDLPVENKAAVEAAMEVVSEKPAEGAWNWFGDQMAVFRTKEYWEPYQKVTVNLRLAGVQAAEGVYGIKNSQINFEVGRAQFTEIDDDTHRMVVERDGEQIKDFPISNGNATTRAYTTTSGVHLTMEKYEHLVMDSATVGIPEGHPDYYKLDVQYAVRFSNSGEFTHAAPWNGSLGQANMSHGCTNMSTEDAKWFYENSLMGDPLTITGTDRELEVDNGWGYWQRSWDEWLANSNLGESDKTDEAGSPGSPLAEPAAASATD
ncbi:Ig-like domain-containing protein [Marinactinospora thermotolerans]|uniref:Lipoprotein-anchoring transpeptidase ErfK/SrfK n=1 Tax=Marinactinospora thermotolerans DSM 45154 TaxID=1122192 RepID=A0A1T4MD96_9ACTN|nr:Ig-like domain-containing protein [Marinactinospora thermotolerans]SJZ64999.1 Lipoprotein-anchoring transpeptidase ErfK/SrfK [Marinactinospora thermotolerans DSM 45154]